MKTVHLEMVREFQCPGCVCTPDFDAETPAEQVKGCESFRPCSDGWNMCEGHVLGTSLGIGNNIALGLPRGFNKPGVSDRPERKDGSRNTMYLHFITKDELEGEFDHFNVPVWAMEQKGHLFVRALSPRINRGYVTVIKGATVSDLPKQFTVIDVAEFQKEID